MRLPRFQQSSLKTRVVLAVALLFVVFASLLTWLTLRHFDQSFRQNFYQQQFVLASTLANTIDDKLRQSQDMLTQVAGQLPPQALQNPQRAQEFLDQKTALKTLFTNGLLLIDAQGRVVAESPYIPGRRGRDVSGLEVFKVVTETRQPYISKPFASVRAMGRPVITMALPLFNAQGAMVGRLHGSIELLGRNFLSDLNDFKLGQTGYVSLFTRDRIFISNRNPTRILQPIVLPGLNPLVDRAVGGFEGSDTVVNSRGVELITSFKHLRTVPWILSLNLPLDEAAEPLQQARNFLLLAIAAGTTLVVILIWLLMRKALAPLEVLTQHVRDLPRKQGTDRRLALSRDDEIGTLVQSFNTMVEDLDQQRQILQESEARFRSLAQMSTDWFWEQDELYRFTQVSQGFRNSDMAAQLGKTRWEQAIVAPGPQEWELHRQLLDRREPFSNFIYQLRDSHGRVRTLTISGTPIFDEQGVFRGYRGVGSDISDRRAAEQRIEYLAYHDALTGLPNRLLVQDRFEQAMAQAERSNTKVALVYLDLDNFKTINDTLGHAAGDEFLKEVARRLRACVRDSDTISRQGGDEFLLVLRDLPDTEIVSTVVIKIMERLQEPLRLDTQELSSSASIGVAIGPDDGLDFETLRKKADLAMYRSKESGRNAWHFFDPTMDAEAGEHLLMRNGLRRALERQEFVLYYQPQYELANGTLIGVEALIRWQHPELGLVAPGRFIGVAEESGLIVPMGDWVLRQACQQAVSWQRAGLPTLSMSVNLSAIQFKRGNVEQSVERALTESGLAPALLELELTESILIQNIESVLTSVRRLKQLGVKLAIDDFGTGYSSLSYLKRLDIDKLKIDQSFVRDLANDPDDAAIVRAIIQMARSLNLQTIAEGVETEEMRSQLQAFGCDAAQGYLYSRPVPAQDIERLLRQAQTN
ncbi:EAL domain-containing protein [Rhodoferax sp. BAB1]|uniref:bifunctional diguanylate cyclase/phosphodiesterase n=1 Tax=Rhodoferax sp. BAB1 TaxID=2741720 RepID=UPI001576F7CD|nr:EAL domain-containing protein [Rhodoferax sp. BAB1]QKO20850.1 EAL domain-containing protein [Rhodoferax sp. BAB1]